MPGPRGKGCSWLLLLLIVLIGLYLAWCYRQEPAESAMDCPAHDSVIAVFDTTIREIPIASETSRIPEFHDCQRFRVAGGFGPLVAIWAAQGLERYFPDSASAEHDSVAIAVAGILDYGTGRKQAGPDDDYAPLSIQAGFNCLYLWRTSPRTFEARIVWQPGLAELSSCVGRRMVDARLRALPSLSVTVTPVQEGSGLTVPPVARWDWDSRRQVQYIGIACGKAWCEVGPPGGFTPSPSAASDPVIGPALTAAFEPAADFGPDGDQTLSTLLVKGWYDQQELEIWNAKGELVPSGVVGTIVPHPVLQAIANKTATQGNSTGEPAQTGPGFEAHWEPAAYLYVNKPYVGKYIKLEPGVSRMYICHGTADVCPGASAISAPASTLWWSKLVSPSGASSEIKAVEYNTHGGGVIPAGAARWRWLETDGKTWLRCGFGCCTDR